MLKTRLKTCFFQSDYKVNFSDMNNNFLQL